MKKKGRTSMNVQNNTATDTAERASEKTLEALFEALENRNNFKLEAGAGAGKTYSLIQALKHILKNKTSFLPRSDQRVACLTYTNVASDEVKARTDNDPAIFVDTLHGFLWEMISPYQKALATALQSSPDWKKKLEENSDVTGLPIEYDLGIRGISGERITLHHDDIPRFAIELFKKEKFRALIVDRFPVIFIDEYQDTPSDLAEAILSGHAHDRTRPIVGFFGDHWQQIYDKTCGSLEHPSLVSIAKNANFRSDRSIIEFLNKLRPELPQISRTGASGGTVTVYHSNAWQGARQCRAWKGQISDEATQSCLKWVQRESPSSAWAQASESPKILMLTHTAIAKELGYSSLARVFRYNDSFIRKENPVIEFLVDTLEPAMEAFRGNKYGELFRVLGSTRPMLTSPEDKLRCFGYFKSLDAATKEGSSATIGDVLDSLCSQVLFSIPTGIMDTERELEEALKELDPEEELKEPRKLVEHNALRRVPYRELRALRGYLENSTPFSTKHSVKGAEFDNVIVVIGRGWTKYDFAKMIAAHAPHSNVDDMSPSSFKRSRNLFYVSASRAKRNLALLFVQKLEDEAITVLEDWVGQENVISIDFDESGVPL